VYPEHALHPGHALLSEPRFRAPCELMLRRSRARRFQAVRKTGKRPKARSIRPKPAKQSRKFDPGLRHLRLATHCGLPAGAIGQTTFNSNS